MVQTLYQQKANQKFARREEKKMGKSSEALQKKRKSKVSVSGVWLALMLFAVLGGLIFEFVRLFWRQFF